MNDFNILDLLCVMANGNRYMQETKHIIVKSFEHNNRKSHMHMPNETLLRYAVGSSLVYLSVPVVPMTIIGV